MDHLPKLPPRAVLLPQVAGWLVIALLHPVIAEAQNVPSGFVDQSMITGLVNPVGFTHDANGRMYIWEKRGTVRLYEGGALLPTLFLDISDEVGNWRDHGMLGFALDPDFLNNGHCYVLYAVDRHHLMNHGTPQYDPNTNEYFAATIMRIARFTATGPGLSITDPGSRTVLLGETAQTGVPLLHESHSTGQLVFGTDGTLLAAFGDGASYSLVDAGSANGTYWAQALADGIIRPAENVGAFRSQLVNCFNGKVVRMDPATGDGVPSNPFYDADDPRSPRSRVWAMGLRNPYRMTLRPGTGSTDPSLGDPGSLYIGDVGWSTWEDLHVCNEGGLNFGWPLFEGMDPHTGYWNAVTANLDAPNPLYDGVNCTIPHYRFQDLLIQETQVHPKPFPNPCDANYQIPQWTPRFMHTRPPIDFRHGNQSRCAAWNGTTAVSYDLDDPASPVPGPRFGGWASIAGTWFQGDQFPQGYQNVYFHADYPGGWIRKFEFDPADQAVSVSDFASALGAIVYVGEGTDGALWYIAYNQNAVRRIVYANTVDLDPVAAATQDVVFGPSPLEVQFTGSGSTDPEGQALSYLWDFGDGNTSTDADPMHTFTAAPATPTTHTVQLTVTDPGGNTGSAQLIVSVNNSPPQVTIDAPVDGASYPVGVTTNVPLQATVTDAEHGPGQLAYAWRTVLHHNTHVHPEPIDNDPVTNALITGEGCDGEEFSYEVRLTVTDAAGLSASDTAWLFPDCSAIAPVAFMTSDKTSGEGPLQVAFDAGLSFDPGTIVSYAWDFGDGAVGSGEQVTHTFNDVGDHVVQLTCTDDDGLVGTAFGTIVVYELGVPQCAGPSGSILREYWTGIPGTAIQGLLSDPGYPDQPDGTSQQTSYSAPQNWADNYGTRMRGYIVPPQSGQYRFTVTSDDLSQFYLSLNHEPRHKRLTASVPGWTQPLEFTKYASQTSAYVELEAGRAYYTEMLHKEGGGGDHLSVFWEGPGIPTRTLVPGSALIPWQDCLPSVNVKVVLQGAADPQSGIMRDDLRLAGLIPTQEPFTGLGFQHAGGGGGEVLDPQVLTNTGLNAIVDWVLVELRDPGNASSIIATRSALLQRDGDVVEVNGGPRLQFNVPAGSYLVAVRHRNHLGAMAAAPVQLDEDITTLDLRSGDVNTHGTEARVLLPAGIHALWCGNVSPDGALRYTGTSNDRDPILNGIGGVVPTNSVFGYFNTDVDLDGQTKYTGSGNDRDPILNNIGGVVPTAVRAEQLP